ncbi:MAG: PhoX family phosphatase [Planktotalea sp.]|uniref:PhoX family protein n=1 Tax=Planktotalea sp. TaxID=2029877 RepID=UPI003C78F6DA
MNREELSFDDYDETINPAPENTGFDTVVETALSRRGFLGGVMSFGVGTFVLGTTALSTPAGASADRFGFEQVAANTLDTITVPEGFEWKPLTLWGDPLWSDVPAFDEATRGTAASQARAFGDNNDGMSVFNLHGKTLMVVNNEYTNRKLLWGNRPDAQPETDDDIEKGMMAHGVSVFQVTPVDGDWQVMLDSDLNRRITPRTEMDLTGPAAGHDLMKTAADPTGTKALGTWNNCGNGETPWGTYLACEENFNGYFSAEDEAHEVSAELKRYGVSSKDWGYGWAKVDERFDVSKNPNEPNRAGYVVEIDPFNPTSTPKKRTALGRFKHENAEVVIAANGKVVVYMGDDERGEFLYRFVSNGIYTPTGSTEGLLDDGVLSVAKFNDDMTGVWLELTPETTGMSAAEISIHTRMAASKVGATTMDRPEWVAANPAKVEAYVALTNNKNRGVKPNAGGDDTSANGVNPREANNYGQIARWVPDAADHTAKGFIWDLYALAGNPDVHSDAYAGSDNINAGNMFNSPDGLLFDDNGLLWIQTDGAYSNEGDFAGMGNNQMLVGDTVTGEIRRFMVGPKECEVTGMCWSPDRRTMFVGIQHPGEKSGSHFPHGGDTLPRSGVFAISRKDGAVIG